MTNRYDSSVFDGETESHWYERSGRPAYTQPNASKPGTERPTTVRDARKLGLLPSVTTILRMTHKEALQRYLINQHLMAAVSMDRLPNETQDSFVKRVVEQAQRHGTQAAEFGTRLHLYIEHVLSSGGIPEPALNMTDIPVALGVKHWLEEHIVDVEALELNLADPEAGYAGRLDCIAWVMLDGYHSSFRCLIDWKTQESREENKHRFNYYPENAIQGAAYSALLKEPMLPCLVLYIDSKLPGHIEPVVYTHETHPWRWPAFVACKLLYYSIGPWAVNTRSE